MASATAGHQHGDEYDQKTRLLHTFTSVSTAENVARSRVGSVKALQGIQRFCSALMGAAGKKFPLELLLKFFCSEVSATLVCNSDYDTRAEADHSELINSEFS